MPTFDNYLALINGNFTPDAVKRAISAWQRIQDKPYTLVVRRGGVKQAAQTVRLEYDNTASDMSADGNAVVGMRRLVVYGVRNHPTVVDTDIVQGDRFGITSGEQSAMYTIQDVMYTLGELQAVAERVT